MSFIVISDTTGGGPELFAEIIHELFAAMIYINTSDSIADSMMNIVKFTTMYLTCPIAWSMGI